MFVRIYDPILLGSTATASDFFLLALEVAEEAGGVDEDGRILG